MQEPDSVVDGLIDLMYFHFESVRLRHLVHLVSLTLGLRVLLVITVMSLHHLVVPMWGLIVMGLTSKQRLRMLLGVERGVQLLGDCLLRELIVLVLLVMRLLKVFNSIKLSVLI